MKEEFKYYFTNFFKLDRQVGYERYRKQEWVIMFLILIPGILLYFILDYYAVDTYTEEFYKLGDQQQRLIERYEFLKLHISFLLFYLFMFIISFTNEVQRFNFRNVSWKKNYAIKGGLILLSVVIFIYQYTSFDIGFPFAIFILLLSSFTTIANRYMTREEELQ